MGDICTCFDFEPDFSTQCYIAWHCTAFPILSNLYLLLLAISSTWAVCAKLRSAAAGSCSACTFCRKVWPSCGSMDCSRFWIPLTSVKANWNSTLWKKKLGTLKSIGGAAVVHTCIMLWLHHWIWWKWHIPGLTHLAKIKSPVSFVLVKW